MKYTTKEGDIIEGTPQEISDFNNYSAKELKKQPLIGGVRGYVHSGAAKELYKGLELAEKFDKAKKNFDEVKSAKEPAVRKRKYNTVNYDELMPKFFELLKNSNQPVGTGYITKKFKISHIGYLTKLALENPKVSWVKRKGFVYAENDDEYFDKIARKKLAPKRQMIISGEEADRRSSRMTFINVHAQQLMKLNTGMNMNEAYKRATVAYNDLRGELPPGVKRQNTNGNKVYTSTNYVKEFPHIKPLKQESIKVLQDIVRNCVNTSMHKIRFADVQTLETNNEVWSIDSWREFLVDFVMHYKQIISLFDVNGKFIVEKDSDGHEMLVWYRQ